MQPTPLAIVTGASGFIGSHLVRALEMRRVAVVSMGVGSKVDSRPHLHVNNVADTAHLRQLLRSLPRPPKWIFHLAGITTGQEIRTVNVRWAEALLEAVAAETPQTVVTLVGSAAEYGSQSCNAQSMYGYSISEDTTCNPVTPYAQSKLAQTDLGLKASARQPVVIVRPFNVIGCGMSPTLALGNFVRQALMLEGKDPTIPRFIQTGPLHAVRDFVHVEMCVNAMLHLADTKSAFGHVVNIATGVGMQLRELIGLLCQQIAPVCVRSPDSPADVFDIAVGSTAKLRFLDFVPQVCNVPQVISEMLNNGASKRR